MNKNILYIILFVIMLCGIVSATDYTIGVYKVANSSTLILNYNGTTIKNFDTTNTSNLSDSFTISGIACNVSGLSKDELIQELGVQRDDIDAILRNNYMNYTAYKENFETTNISYYGCQNDLKTANERWDNLNISWYEDRKDKDMYSSGIIIFVIISVIELIVIIMLLLYYNGYFHKVKGEIDAKREGH